MKLARKRVFIIFQPTEEMFLIKKILYNGNLCVVLIRYYLEKKSIFKILFHVLIIKQYFFKFDFFIGIRTLIVSTAFFRSRFTDSRVLLGEKMDFRHMKIPPFLPNNNS